MRDVVLQMGITLDGYVHGDKGYEDWGLGPEDDDLVEWKAASLWQAGVHAMGRRSYDDMASFWPHQTGVYADVMNQIPKAVFSSTLTTADWAESRIFSGGLADDIATLRSEDGGPVLVHGGATFINSLVAAGLIDEYRLVIHPVVIGHGHGLFESLDAPLQLDLVEMISYPSGRSTQVYRPQRPG